MALSEDKLKQFEQGKIELKDFTPEETRELEALMAKEPGTEVAPAEADNLAVKDEVPAPPVAEKPEEDASKPNVVDGAKYKEKADEANTFRQRADSYARQLEETRAQLELLKKQQEVKVETPVTNPDVIWSDKHQIDLVAEVTRLKALVETGIKGSQEKLQKLERELADKQTFAEVDAFQHEFPELRLDRSFEEANKEYIQFTKRLGATPNDLSVVDRYFQDAAFRAEQEAKGIKAPKDYAKLERILQTFHTKQSRGYPNYRSAYLAEVLTPAELEKRLSGRYLEGVQDVVNKISSNRTETTLLDQGKSGGNSGLNMSEAQMEAWMAQNPYPVTAQQKQTMAQIQEYIRARAMGGVG